MKCPKCSRDIDQSQFPKGLVFCPYCGDNIASSRKEKVSGVAFCPYCGQELSDHMKFCPNCGKEMPVVKEPEPEETEHKDHEIIDRAASAIKSTFGQDRKKMKLYKQWVEHSGLPQDDMPKVEEGAPEAPVVERRQGSGQRQQIPTVYMVLGAAIILFIVAIVIVVITFFSS